MKKFDHTKSFWAALHRGEKAAVKAALDKGVDPNTPLALGKESPNAGLVRPLGMAAGCGHAEICKLLLDHGADLEDGRLGLTPLLQAAVNGHEKVVALLRKRGARVNFFVRVALNDATGVQRDLKKNPDLLEQQDEAGQTPLHHAARKLSAKLVKLLLNHGACADAPGNMKKTPLHLACDRRAADPNQQIPVLQLLLKYDADVNARDVRGVTPLHMAVRARNVAACEFLLKHGAKVDAKDKGRGSTPLRRAVTNTGASGTAGRTGEALAITKLLLKHGANPAEKDRKGRRVEQSARSRTIKKSLALA